MLSLGAAAFRADKQMIDTFAVNIELLHEATTDPETTQQWSNEAAAWQACRDMATMGSRQDSSVLANAYPQVLLERISFAKIVEVRRRQLLMFAVENICCCPQVLR